MEIVRMVRLNTFAALIVQLRDLAAGGPPVGPAPAVRLAGVPKQPVAKPDGSFIFSDLPPGEYRLEVDSLYYFRIVQAVFVRSDRSSLIVPISLTPLPSYPFKSGDTTVRFLVRDAFGMPQPAAAVTAAVLTEEASPYRLAQDEAAAGSTELTVSPGNDRIGPGDRFTLKARGASTNGEIVEVAATDTGKRIRLAAPLQHTYIRNSYLLPAFITKTTEQGEAVIFFRGCRSRTFQASLEFRSADGRLTSAQSLALTEGQTLELGIISLS